MSKNNNTNLHNQANQTPNRRQRQAKTPAVKKPAPDGRTDEAGYQKLPASLRPFAGFAQRDPLDYDSHPYPSMKQFAGFLALRFDAPRTRHSYYRQMRLVHEFCACDPATITEGQLRDYILHVKTKKLWKPKTIRQSAAAARLFFVEMIGHDDWKIFSQIRTKDDNILIGAAALAPQKPPHIVSCPCCGEPMKKLLRLLPAWSPARAPPPLKKQSCA